MNIERLQQAEKIRRGIAEGFNKIAGEHYMLKKIIEDEVREQAFERFGGLTSDTELERLIKTHLETYQANKIVDNMTIKQIKERTNVEREVISIIKSIAKAL